MKTLKVLEGPTAAGKTSLAIEWARAAGTEIISADSRQFYRELNIGVARPSPEELASVPHHFIACKSVTEYYSVSKFEREALQLLQNLFQKYDTVVMAGGSGLYVNAVCNGIDLLPDPAPELREDLKKQLAEKGIEHLRAQLKLLDPEYYKQVDLSNSVRLRRALEVCLTTGKPFSSLRTKPRKQRPFKIERYVLNRPREEMYARINARVDAMMAVGLLEEVRSLRPLAHLNALQTVGYRELFRYFNGEISLEQAVEEIKKNTRRYCKRQLTWLRAQPDLTWL